jgi:plasmid stability protein
MTAAVIFRVSSLSRRTTKYMINRNLHKTVVSITSLTNMQSMTDGGTMASMTIRDIDEKLKSRLRIQAARHGRSMEDEARDILRSALSVEPTQARGLVEAIRARVESLGGVELEIAPREPMREPVNLDK